MYKYKQIKANKADKKQFYFCIFFIMKTQCVYDRSPGVLFSKDVTINKSSEASEA